MRPLLIYDFGFGIYDFEMSWWLRIDLRFEISDVPDIKNWELEKW
jgi:hypothetical protein